MNTNNFEEIKKSCPYRFQEKRPDGETICLLNDGDCCEANCMHTPAVPESQDECSDGVEQQTTNVDIPVNADTKINIRKIIEGAMEKKDRMISIFITPAGTNITIQPYSEEKPRWIEMGDADTTRFHFKCSECDRRSDYSAPYCPACGEKLAAPEYPEHKGGIAR